MDSRAWCGMVMMLVASVTWAADPAADAAAPAAAEADATPAGDTAAEAPAEAGAAPDAPANASAAPPVVPDREAELAAIVPRLTAADELQWLGEGAQKFFAFRRQPPSGPPKGAILIVPAPTDYIDERELTRQLRTLPPAGGFVTLAVQPPLSMDATAGDVTEAEAAPAEDAAQDAEEAPKADATDAAAIAARPPPVHTEFCPRLAAALAALAADQPPLIAVVAEGDSMTAVLGCHPQGLPETVGAVAAIGAWQGDWSTLTQPTLELVPDLDPAAVRAADGRAARPRADDSPPRRRVDLVGVDRRFVGAGEDIAKRVRGWLERLPRPAAAQSADSAEPTSKR